MTWCRATKVRREMAVKFRQSTRMGMYLARQRLAKRERFPLIVELEPLFQCNLACSGCGKIQHPEHVLRRRMPVEQAVGAIEESGAPMVSIAGGEPLIHPEIHEIAGELVRRKKFVYLCTNALLLERKLENFKPSPYFAWAIHMDGLRERHDASVEREGVFDKAVSAIRAAKAAGFRVTTNTTFFTHDSLQDGARGARLPQRRPRRRRDDDLARLRLRESPRPGALPRRGTDPQAVQRGLRGRPAPALAAEPQPAVPRLPRGQGGIRLHRLGDPQLLAVRLAAPLLPDGRRLRRRPTASCSRRPTGTPTGAAGTRAARTAWPTAATSRRRCCRRPTRCASHCARSSAEARTSAAACSASATTSDASVAEPRMSCQRRPSPSSAGTPSSSAVVTSTACRMIP